MAQKRDIQAQLKSANEAVAWIEDGKLRQIAFTKLVESGVEHPRPHWTDSGSRLAQVVSVVVGVVLSVQSYNDTRQKEAAARADEARAASEAAGRFQQQRLDEAERLATEAARPFLELRQQHYLEVVRVAAVLANSGDYAETELAAARKRLRALYVAELSLVEGAEVEKAMMKLAEQVDPSLTQMSPGQVAAYELSHALRDSLARSWKIDEKVVDNENP
jgi:hypothetical protein